MRMVQVGQAFSFNYTTYDQNSGLDIAFNVYDVTTGSAVYVTQILPNYITLGSYSGNYTGALDKTYLIIGVVYTDDTLMTPDLTRAPSADVYQVIQASTIYFGIAYAAINQDALLDVRASLYRLTTGSPVFVSHVTMTEVDFGVYFGSFTGSLGNTYQAISAVYTDNTFTTPDLAWAPSSDSLDAIQLESPIQIVGSASLIGPSLAAILIS